MEHDLTTLTHCVVNKLALLQIIFNTTVTPFGEIVVLFTYLHKRPPTYLSQLCDKLN